jgi:hypothetical protein
MLPKQSDCGIEFVLPYEKHLPARFTTGRVLELLTLPKRDAATRSYGLLRFTV